MHQNIVQLEWLAQRLGEPDVVVADCRFNLGNPNEGKQAYQAGHIPGAIFFDLEEDLSSPVGVHGGRHPLPDLETFIRKLGMRGIGGETTVVAYDDQGGTMASRLWWMLQFLGHDRVYVLERGFSAWKSAGYPVTIDLPELREREFTGSARTDMLASMEEVKALSMRPEAALIDSREAGRYKGLFEPIDPVAGHIPGALNYFWKDNLREDGTWKSPEELRRRFVGLSDSEEIAVYCGSGVSACPNVLALREAGFRNVKLYAGSWSDWISYPDNRIATGEE
ncbi:sulfurtransferase [Ferviditalea candida]|uniref:Sulfurtransferase n=1 Tax=Ferviditalea candida TaxID=3108399 RepID=A0ABU5ZHB4_9BACL|nr:sulfurtransferase [Paenibacillaceae bacterium T2]